MKRPIRTKLVSQTFGTLKLQSENIFAGKVMISRSFIDIIIEVDPEDHSHADYLATVKRCEKIYQGLSSDLIEAFKIKASKDITVAAYEPIEQAIDNDIVSLSNDMTLSKIMLFRSGGILYWKSTSIFPHMEISLQFDSDFHIEDIIIL